MRVKLPLWDTPQPKPGTMGYKFCQWFVDNINWCEGYYYGTDTPKPENKLYSVLWEYWLFPFKNNGCACCIGTRSLVYGLVLGFILGRLLS